MRHNWRQVLLDAIASKNTSMKKLSLDAGLGETYVRDLVKRNRAPSIDNAMKICAELEMPVAAIFGDQFGGSDASSNERIIEVGGQEFAKVPVYDIRYAAGWGSENYDEDPIDHYLLSLSLLHSLTDAPISEIAFFKADGRSMEPVINHDDWFAVDLRKKKLINPGIYALVFEGEGLLKHASQHLETGAVTLMSENSASYPPQTIKKPDRLNVVGRVFLSIRRH